MHDLRRQALESKKTVSRKAKSRASSQQASPIVSARSSRQSSRNVSRYASDEEDNGSQSDLWSTGSVDEFMEGEEEAPPEDLQASLGDVINEVIDRKRSSVQSREDALLAYIRFLTSKYVEQGLEGHLQDLLAAFAKSIRSESSERETLLALKAVGLTAVTMLDSTIYEAMAPLIRRTVSDSEFTPVKAAAIHALAACTFFGGAGEEGIMDQMDFLMEVVSSDGHFVNAPDDAESVAAALEEWGFLATEVEDFEQESEDAIEVFTEQLNSGDTRVQIAAGENIALLYEKSYSPLEEGEEAPDEEEEDVSSDERSSSPSDDEDDNGDILVKRYNAYHNTPQIIHQVSSLANVSGKHINKRDKKSLHANFTSILNTVENPRRGPHYNKAIDSETNRSYGSRKTVKFQQDSFMRVDRWWKWLRLAALRRLLGGGFVAHYFEGNRAVLDCLPVMLRTGAEGRQMSPRSKARERAAARKGGRRKAVEGF